MQATAMIAMDHHEPNISALGVTQQASSEVSRLLARAIHCVDQDEAIAIDLVKRASMLMKPSPAVSANAAPRERAASGGLAPWQVARVKRYVEDNMSRTVAIDELAELARLSTSYFSAAFKTSFGLSPHSYVIAQRVERAKQLMLSTDAPLCEIALDCGLADQAHLSRIFRRATGTTPSAWRRFRLRPAARREAAEYDVALTV
ncbi:helix-turn-helix transcriptional regulator [Rhizobium sp. 16-449-1b]|uniref:helix-turn-helix domain-containing protein n=1 Tax=Rhizobium sp. 16-449-1b TaxID=2819989 RepID=UPI001ADAF2A3|nr:AraC family transcriptional regulator [Rhizobium sp. 16-449-1b]MBO9198089.1 helix-turn-helix transcriptional regulator [Rhizobium sp. 16-449-1b]